MEDIVQFMNVKKQVTSWPAKGTRQLSVLRYMADQFAWDRKYTEPEVNEILNKLHTFEDPALLRRELYMKQFLDRKTDGSMYWRTMRQMPQKWMTKNLVIEDSREEEAIALQEVYDDCAYIGEWTGGDREKDSGSILRELHHENLPPEGQKEFHRLQSIRLKESKELIGYIALYHGFPVKESLWIAVFSIAKKYQGKKFGQELITELAKEAKTLDFRSLGGCVGIKNWPALRFWIQVGFDHILKMEGDKVCSEKTFAELWLSRTL